MTKQSDFKKRVRTRMVETGESYTTARTQLIAKAADSPPGAASPDQNVPGRIEGYPAFGGEHVDVAVLTHVLEQAGVEGYDGAALSEAMVFGLMGGPGFMYFVFEYAGWAPLLTIVLRSFSMPDPLVDAALERLGVKASVATTGSAKRALATLDQALGAGKAPICTIDAFALPHRELPGESMGSQPQLVAVVGHDAEHVWLECDAERPVRLTHEALAEARGAYKKLKHRLVSIDGPSTNRPLDEAVRSAIAATARGYHEAPFKGLGSNFGLAGIDKWADLLTSSAKKGWGRLFAEGEARARGLMRLDECLWRTYSPALGGRALYADFLEEASAVLGAAWPTEAAASFRSASGLWAGIIERVRSTSDDTVRALIELNDRRSRLIRERGHEATAEQARLVRERETIAKAAESSIDDDPTLFGDLAALAREVASIERAAVDRLSRGSQGP